MAKIRKAWRPRRLSVGTRSKNAISSSTVMDLPRVADSRYTARPWRQCRLLRHQLVSACFGHQDRWAGSVLLDLLTQPVDMGFEGMRGHTRVVTPHFLQQRL